MQRDEFRGVVEEAVRKSLAEAKVDLSVMPDPQLQVLVGAIADGVFAGLEATLDESMNLIDGQSATNPSSVAVAAASATAASAAQGQALAPPAAEEPVPKSMERAAAAAAAVPPASAIGEVLLWRGRPYLTVGTIYELTSQRLRVIRGLIGNNLEEIELVRVRDTRVTQNAGERMFDIGDITVVSSDATTPEKILYNVRNPLDVRELIRKAVLVERDRRKMMYREDMYDNANEAGHDDTQDDMSDAHS